MSKYKYNFIDEEPQKPGSQKGKYSYSFSDDTPAQQEQGWLEAGVNSMADIPKGGGTGLAAGVVSLPGQLAKVGELSTKTGAKYIDYGAMGMPAFAADFWAKASQADMNLTKNIPVIGEPRARILEKQRQGFNWVSDNLKKLGKKSTSNPVSNAVVSMLKDMWTKEAEVAGNIKDASMKWAEPFQESAKELSGPGKFAFDVTRSLPQMGAAALTGPAAPLTFGVLAGGSYAQQAEQAGATEEEQFLFGLTGAIIEGATEKFLGFDQLAKMEGLGFKDAIKRALINMGSEALQEGGAEIASSIAEQAIYNPEKLMTDGRFDPEKIKATAMDVGYSATVGAVSGGIHSGVASAYGAVDNRIESNRAKKARFNESLGTLGLGENATAEQINAAYRQFAKTGHPDVGGSAETFSTVTDAKTDALNYINRMSVPQKVKANMVQAVERIFGQREKQSAEQMYSETMPLVPTKGKAQPNVQSIKSPLEGMQTIDTTGTGIRPTRQQKPATPEMAANIGQDLREGVAPKQQANQQVLTEEPSGGIMKFRKATPEEFVQQRSKNVKKDFLTPYTPEEMKDWDLNITEDGVGYALTPEMDMVGVFNNSKRKGAGQQAVIDAIGKGAKTCDAISGYLDDYYKWFGFEESERVQWDDQYAPKGWDYDKYGRPDVVYLIYPESLSREPGEIASRFKTARAEFLARDPRSGGRSVSTGELHQENGRVDITPRGEVDNGQQNQVAQGIKSPGNDVALTEQQKNQQPSQTEAVSSLENEVKSAGFQDAAEAYIAMEAADNNYQEFKKRNPKASARTYAKLRKQFNALPEALKLKFRSDLQFFAENNIPAIQEALNRIPKPTVARQKEKGKVHRVKYQETWRRLMDVRDAKQTGKERLERARAEHKTKLAKVKEESKAKLHRVKYQETWRRLMDVSEAKRTGRERLERLRKEHKARELHHKELRRERAEEQRIVKADKKRRNKLIEGLKGIDIKHLRPEYQRPVKAIIDEINLTKPTKKTIYKLTRLAQWLEKNPDSKLPSDVISRLKVLDRRNIRDMATDDIQTIHDAVSHFVHLNKLKNKLVIKGRERKLDEVVNEAVPRIRKHITAKQTPGSISMHFTGKKVGGGKKFFYNQLQGRTIAQILDGDRQGPLREVIIDGANDARDRELTVKYEGKDFLLDGLKKYGIDPSKDIQNWSDEFNKKEADVDIQKIKLPSGRIFSVTKGVRIALYLHSLNENNLASIVSGGVYSSRNTREKISLTEDGLQTVIDSMTDEERNVAKVFYRFYNEYSKDKLNEASLELDGWERGREENYYPKRVADATMEKRLNDMRDNPYGRFTVEGQGFLKSRTGSKKGIILEDAFVTAHRHLEGLAAYCGRAMYLRNARMFLENKQIKNSLWMVDNGFTWKKLNDYVNDFESDQGRFTDEDNWTNRMLRNTDTAILALNFRVGAKQFLSYPLMFNHINQKYLIETMGKPVDWDNVHKYSVQLRQRSEGYVSVEKGELSQVGTVRTFWTGKRPTGELLTAHIEKADNITLGNLWNAVEAETRAEHQDLKGEEFYHHVGKRVEGIFFNTQSVFDPKDRSALGRSKNVLVRAFTRFTSQRNVIFNEIVRSTLDYNQSQKTSKDKTRLIGKIFNMTVVAGILELGIDAVWDWLRGRKVEKNPIKMAARIVGSIIGNVYGIGDAYNTIMSYIEKGGYSAMNYSAPAVQVANELFGGLANAVKAVEEFFAKEIVMSGSRIGEYKFKRTVEKAIDQLGSSITSTQGLPWRNVKTMKEILEATIKKINGE